MKKVHTLCCVCERFDHLRHDQTHDQRLLGGQLQDKDSSGERERERKEGKKRRREEQESVEDDDAAGE